MLRNIKSLLGYKLQGTDGCIGQVDEFYFEEDTWVIHYLIVKTGDWFLNRNLFISPKLLVISEKEPRVFLLNRNREQIKSSPNFDRHHSVMQNTGEARIGHFSSQMHVTTAFCTSVSDVSKDHHLCNTNRIKLISGNELFIRSFSDFHLRFTKRLSGYNVYTHREDFGQISDFILDVRQWQIISMVIDAHNWFGGKRFITSVGAIKEIQWDNSVIILSIPRNRIKNCPEYDETHFKYFQSVIR